MKRVFSSHSEVTHVWAQQTQTEGRAGNIFFENTTDLYSYGRHYLMAKIHTRKGRRFALINSFVYSNSTAKHLYCTRDALRGLMPFFSSPNPESVKETVKYLDSQVIAAIERARKRKFFADSWHLGDKQAEHIKQEINRAYAVACDFRNLIGKPDMRFPHAKFLEASLHLANLQAAYDSPERRAKRRQKELDAAEERAERQRLWNEQEKLRGQKAEEALAAFRAGEPFSQSAIGTEYDLLRVKGSRVETSRGAVVPLVAAKELLKRIEDFQDIIGLRIGSFTVESMEYTDHTEKDSVIKIGCHRILLSEAKRVLSNAAGLTLVTAEVSNG